MTKADIVEHIYERANTSKKDAVEVVDQVFELIKARLEQGEKIKLSGYVQGRFQYADASAAGLDAKAAPLIKDGFSVRRGRLKAAQEVLVLNGPGSTPVKAKVNQILMFEGLERVQVEEADHADLTAGSTGPRGSRPTGHPASSAQ